MNKDKATEAIGYRVLLEFTTDPLAQFALGADPSEPLDEEKLAETEAVLTTFHQRAFEQNPTIQNTPFLARIEFYRALAKYRAARIADASSVFTLVKTDIAGQDPFLSEFFDLLVQRDQP